jgi:hypothetical protein
MLRRAGVPRDMRGLTSAMDSDSSEVQFASKLLAMAYCLDMIVKPENERRYVS